MAKKKKFNRKKYQKNYYQKYVSGPKLAMKVENLKNILAIKGTGIKGVGGGYIREIAFWKTKKVGFSKAQKRAVKRVQKFLGIGKIERKDGQLIFHSKKIDLLQTKIARKKLLKKNRQIKKKFKKRIAEKMIRKKIAILGQRKSISFVIGKTLKQKPDAKIFNEFNKNEVLSSFKKTKRRWNITILKQSGLLIYLKKLFQNYEPDHPKMQKALELMKKYTRFRSWFEIAEFYKW